MKCAGFRRATILLETRISDGSFAMLAEKFFLYLEALIKTKGHADGSPQVTSTSPHVPVKLPERK
jgi:hypothetical protein